MDSFKVNPEEPIALAVTNVISQLMWGESFERGDPDIAKIRDAVSRAQDSFVSPGALVLTSYPWLRHIPLFGTSLSGP